MALSQTIPTSSGLSDLSLCFLTCYNVFGIVVVFSELLFVFYIAFAFVICYFVFRIVICFALIGHRNFFFPKHLATNVAIFTIYLATFSNFLIVTQTIKKHTFSIQITQKEEIKDVRELRSILAIVAL